MPEYKLIHSHVFDPNRGNLFYKPKATDHAEHTTIRCDASDRCEAFAAGKCIALGMFTGCPHGNYSKVEGPTKRARSCREWCQEREKVKPDNKRLEQPARKLMRIGDYIWLPYAHMDMALTGKPGITTSWRDSFIPASSFDVALVVRLCAARPQALFGGEITNYQQESVPAFVQHLHEQFPDIAREAAALSPRVAELSRSMSKVGRKALLRTILPNVGLLRESAGKPAVWAWDGTAMTTSAKEALPPFTPFAATEIRIVPGPDAVAVITDDAQVSPETVFAD